MIEGLLSEPERPAVKNDVLIVERLSNAQCCYSITLSTELPL